MISVMTHFAFTMMRRHKRYGYMSEQKTLEQLEKIQKAAMEETGMTDTPRGRPDAFLCFIAQNHQSASSIEAYYQEWEKL